MRKRYLEGQRDDERYGEREMRCAFIRYHLEKPLMKSVIVTLCIAILCSAVQHATLPRSLYLTVTSDSVSINASYER